MQDSAVGYDSEVMFNAACMCVCVFFHQDPLILWKIGENFNNKKTPLFHNLKEIEKNPESAP